MRALRFALLSALAGASCALTAQAADGQRSGVERTTFNEYKYNSYYAQDTDAGNAPSPSDQAPVAPVAPPADAAPTATDASAAAGKCAPAEPEKPADQPLDTFATRWACCNPCCVQNIQDHMSLGGLIDPCGKLGKPCLLIDHFPCLKECHKVNIAGWLAQSYTWNPQNPANGFNGPVTWTDRSNSYELNQAYIYVERLADNKGEGFAWGYRTDLLFGTDYRFNTESQLETKYQFQGDRAFPNNRFYGLDYLQFYGSVAYNKTNTKIGHFLSPVGYEVIPTALNFFPTLPYIFQYGEPFTHTGFNTTYTLSDTSTVSAGIIRGWDNFGNNNPNLGFLGTYTKTFEDKSSYASVFIWSNEPNQNTTNNQLSGANPALYNNVHSSRWIWTHAYTKPLTDKLTYVAQFDYAQQTDAMVNGRLARWYGYNNYLFYKVSDKWTWGIRNDIWRDEEGFRMGGFLGNTGVTAAQGSLRGLGGNFNNYAGTNVEVSIGANWKPNANMTIRPAVRWDNFIGNSGWSNNQQAFNGTPGGQIFRPYDNGAKDWQIIVGFDWITLF